MSSDTKTASKFIGMRGDYSSRPPIVREYPPTDDERRTQIDVVLTTPAFDLAEIYPTPAEQLEHVIAPLRDKIRVLQSSLYQKDLELKTTNQTLDKIQRIR